MISPGSGAPDYEGRLRRLRRVDLYMVTSESLSGRRTSLDVLDAVLAAGVRMVQLREKEKSKGELYHLACRFRSRTAEAGCLLIVNDHLDVALAAGADGVHLGREDLPIAAARSIAPKLIIGASSHSLAEALEAQGEGADYVNIGPIFPTKTKPEHQVFLGPEGIRDIGSELSIPFSCMGGINRDNIEELVKAGAKIVAVITAVTRAEDMTEAARTLRTLITG